ncbi:hypothetical protein N7527_002918 [Penicillium freii]|nr:hypothetical protein N7527_002918 [Penicillium freii]
MGIIITVVVLINQEETLKSPFLEIYLDNSPEAWACLEHQRQEIAFRKRLHDDQDQEDSESLPPLMSGRKAIISLSTIGWIGI